MLEIMEAWQALFARARNGDRKAFDILVSAYQRDVKSWIRTDIGNPVRLGLEVDDLVQNSFLRAWESIRQFQGETENTWQGWLRKIARNVVRDEMRKLGRRKDPRKNAIPLGPEIDQPRTGTSPTQEPVREERYEELKRALRCLSPDHRKVVLLVFLHGVSIKAAAKELERTSGATSELLSRALKKLKAAYRKTAGSLQLPHDLSLEGELKEDEGELREDGGEIREG